MLDIDEPQSQEQIEVIFINQGKAKWGPWGNILPVGKAAIPPRQGNFPNQSSSFNVYDKVRYPPPRPVAPKTQTTYFILISRRTDFPIFVNEHSLFFKFSAIKSKFSFCQIKSQNFGAPWQGDNLWATHRLCGGFGLLDPVKKTPLLPSVRQILVPPLSQT